MGNTNAIVRQSSGYRKVNLFITYEGKKIEADINTFEDLGFNYARDKNGVFFKGERVDSMLDKHTFVVKKEEKPHYKKYKDRIDNIQTI